MFGQPLEQLTSEEEQVPKPINDLLVRLFRYGPSTSGVFRKTPNQREVKELKEEIDEGWRYILGFFCLSICLSLY